jgi:hypothetical protein
MRSPPFLHSTIPLARKGLALATGRWAVVLLLGLCLWFFRAPLLRSAAAPLVTEEPLADADSLWISLCDARACPRSGLEMVARLQQARPSLRILLVAQDPSRIVQTQIVPTPTSVLQHQLAACAIPPQAITVLPRVARDFWEESRGMSAWLQKHPQARVQLLCPRFSSGNCRWILQRVLAAPELARVQVLAFPYHSDERRWWQSRAGVAAFLVGWLDRIYLWYQGEPQRSPRSWDPDAYQRSLAQQPAEAQR